MSEGRKTKKSTLMRNAILFLLLAGLALFLRVHRLDTTNLWGDQSQILGAAMGWVNGGPIPLTSNKSSVGFMNPPMLQYLYAFALWLWPDILSVAVLTMVMGFGAVIVTGWTVYRAWGWQAAFWGMLLLAVNPWSVYYSQFIWNPTLMPLFSALTLGGTILYFAVEQRPAYLITALVSAACMTQVHLASAIQLFSLGIVFLLFRRKLQVRSLLIGGGIFLLLYLPYFIYQSRVGWQDLQVISGLRQAAASFSFASVLVSLDLMRAQGFHIVVPHLPFFDQLAVVLTVVSLLYGVLRAIAALVRSQVASSQRNIALCISLLWFVTPLLFYLRASEYLQLHYLLSQFPVHFILVGLFFADLQRGLESLAHRGSHPVLKWGLRGSAWLLAPLPLVALVAWQAHFNLYFQEWRQQVPHPDQLRIWEVRAIIQETNTLLAERPDCALAIISDGFFFEDSRMMLLQAFSTASRTLSVNGRLAVLEPVPCAIYLDTEPYSRASAWLEEHATLVERRGDVSESVHLRWRFFLGNSPMGEGHARPIAQWGNGLTLENYQRGAFELGNSLPLTLTWGVAAPPHDDRYHIGVYILSTEMEIVSQEDGPRFDSASLLQGDRIISWFELFAPAELPDELYRVGLVVYGWPDMRRAVLLSGEDWLQLEELSLSP